MEEKELSTTISASPVNSESDAAAVTQPPAQPNDAVFAHNNNSIIGGVVVSSAITTSFSGTEKLKRGRGRPRKYDSDGNLAVSFNSTMASPRQTTPFSVSSGDRLSSSSNSTKRGRGRPSGSGNWQILASLGEIFANTAGGDFTPHVVTVGTGEDVGGRILSFAEKGPRGICVLSANGTVSNVTIRQPGSSGGILTYEGRFEILSLSGSFTVTEISGGRSRTGSMSVSLAGPDGRVIGGSLAGLLTAATPIQIVVGSFMPNGYKIHKRKYHKSEQNVTSPTQPNTLTPETTVTFANPISQSKPPMVVHDTPDPLHPTPPPPPTTTTTTAFLPPQQLQNVQVLAGDQENPKNNGTTNNSNGHGASTPHFVAWNGSDLLGHRSPDINISVPGDL